MSDQMAQAVLAQLAHVRAAHAVDRRGWTERQYADDARRLMGDMDGSVRDLVNGHVTALLAQNARLTAALRTALDPDAQQADIERAREVLEEVEG